MEIKLISLFKNGKGRVSILINIFLVRLFGNIKEIKIIFAIEILPKNLIWAITQFVGSVIMRIIDIDLPKKLIESFGDEMLQQKLLKIQKQK